MARIYNEELDDRGEEKYTPTSPPTLLFSRLKLPFPSKFRVPLWMLHGQQRCTLSRAGVGIQLPRPRQQGHRGREPGQGHGQELARPRLYLGKLQRGKGFRQPEKVNQHHGESEAIFHVVATGVCWRMRWE